MLLFSKNKKKAAAIAAILKHAEKLDRGDIIYWGVIESITGCTRKESFCRDVAGRLNKVFLHHRNIALRCQPNVGYKLLSREEQLKYCARDRQRRATRQLLRGRREVAALPVDELSDYQQRMRGFTLSGFDSELKFVRSNVARQVHEAKRRWESLPRPPRATE